MKKLTRYSGSKNRLLKYLPDVPADTKRLVELYGGSLAWSLNQTLPFLAYEINPKMISMYEWLLTLSPAEIMALPEPNVKTDIRDFGWCEGQNTYYQLNGCSVILGQLSSWTYYPKNKLPKQNTIDALSRLKEGVIVAGDCHQYEYQEGDFVFIDPPYINTKANYIGGEETYQPSQTVGVIDRLPKGRWMMTYSSVPSEFAKYEHKILCKVKVPNIRKGGTVERSEYLFTS